MNAKTSVFVIYIKTIIYFLSYNLHDYTFKCSKKQFLFKGKKQLSILWETG